MSRETAVPDVVLSAYGFGRSLWKDGVDSRGDAQDVIEAEFYGDPVDVEAALEGWTDAAREAA